MAERRRVTGAAAAEPPRVVTADRHSSWLVRAVELVVEGLGLAPADVDAWAVATGPGAFTGLRVGLSTVQGLALASSRPCVGLSSLDVLATLTIGSAPTIVALVDAFRDEVYSGVYDRDARPAGPASVGPVEGVLDGLTGPVAFVGNGAERFRSRIEGRMPAAIFPSHERWLAVALARLTETKLKLASGAPTDPEALRPLYLGGADIRKATP